MDQSQRGNFLVFINDRKSPGDLRPIFEGFISQPGSDAKLDVALWVHLYRDKKTGAENKMLYGNIGAVPQGADAQTQIEALSRADPGDDKMFGNLTIKPRKIILFPNAFKDEAPDKKRPDYWGGVNFGDDSPPMRLSAWIDHTRYGKAMLTGEISLPVPGKSETALQDSHQKPLFGEAEAPAVSKTGRRRTGDGNPDLMR